MQSVSDSMKSSLKRIGIGSTWREKCTICDYGTRIYMIIDGKEMSNCRYCEDQKLVKELNLPTTKEESDRRKITAKSKYFNRIPEDIKNVKLNDYVAETDEQRRVKQLSANYIMHFDKQQSLILSGDPGIGKSHIAVAVTNALSKNYSTLFLKSTNILDLIKESYGGAAHSKHDVLQICADVDLLVIDDLGAEYSKEGESESWASDIIYKVIDSRLGKSLIITTNYNESALEKKYGYNGKRITSRMSDNAEKIRIVGKDMRRE